MKLYGLIGYPLTHSFSKKYFETKFEKDNITDALFELYPLENISAFEMLLADNPDLRGIAVTIPYKETVIPFINELEDEAWEMNAVNCIKISEGKLTGHNTDVKGFEQSFLPLLKPQHTKALVLGSGGSSKAIQYILRKHKIGFLIVSRKGSTSENSISYEEIDQTVMNEFKIIINCTPVGMTPHDEGQPELPYHFLTADHYLYDLVYVPERTVFLQQGEKRNCTVKNGFEMLVIQAEENWRIWNS